MTIITKKRLIIALGVLLTFALVIWYFFPFFMGKWFLYQNDKVKAYLTMQPTYIETLPPVPKEWTDLHLGGITLELPLPRYQKIRGLETQIYFMSESREM